MSALDSDIAELEVMVRAVAAPFEMAARAVGFADLQQYMQTVHGCWPA